MPTRAARRPSTASTRSSQPPVGGPPSGAVDPAGEGARRRPRRRHGQPAERRHHEAAHRLVRAGRQRQPGPLGEVGQVEPAVHLGRPARRHRLRRGVVLVVDLADQLLDQVLQGDDAGGAAVLVDHHREVVPLPAHLRQGREHPLAAGHRLTSRASSPTVVAGSPSGRRSRSRRCTKPITSSWVPSTTGYRVCVSARTSRAASARVRSRGEEDHLGTGHHHLADQAGHRRPAPRR